MKVLIVSKKKMIFYSALVYFLEREGIEYEVCDFLNGQVSQDITNVIYVDYGDFDNIFLSKISVPLINVSNNARLITNSNSSINYLVTPVINDDTNYTNVQKEYLFQKGIYSIILDKIYELISDESDTNGLIMDFTNCKTKLIDWVFKFESIADTYSWLSKKNVNNPDFTMKTISFYHGKIFNDSYREVGYLADKINNIQKGFKSIDIFICNKSELEFFNNNYFYKLLLKNIGEIYQLYIIDRDVLKEKEPYIYNKLLDGVAIYDDCVYIDTFDDEYSLGKVDCNVNTIEEYNKYFDYIINNYGNRVYMEVNKDAI